MAEVLGSPPSPRAALFWNGTAWQWALVDAAGHLQVDALSTVMDAAAATAAAQALALAQLQTIAEIRDTLQSVATDRLIVRGEDQLFSFSHVLASQTVGAISGAEGSIDGPACGPGEIWVVTTICAYNSTTPPTGIYLANLHNAVPYVIDQEQRAFAVNERFCWHGHTYLDEGDSIRAGFAGGLAGDTVAVEVIGYSMTLEV